MNDKHETYTSWHRLMMWVAVGSCLVLPHAPWQPSRLQVKASRHENDPSTALLSGLFSLCQVFKSCAGLTSVRQPLDGRYGCFGRKTQKQSKEPQKHYYYDIGQKGVYVKSWKCERATVSSYWFAGSGSQGQNMLDAHSRPKRSAS